MLVYWRTGRSTGYRAGGRLASGMSSTGQATPTSTLSAVPARSTRCMLRSSSQAVPGCPLRVRRQAAALLRRHRCPLTAHPAGRPAHTHTDRGGQLVHGYPLRHRHHQRGRPAGHCEPVAPRQRVGVDRSYHQMLQAVRLRVAAELARAATRQPDARPNWGHGQPNYHG